MRLHQLRENIDVSALTKLWKSSHLATLVKALEDSAEQEGEDKHDVLAKLIRAGFHKHADTNPTYIFHLLKQIILNVQEIVKQQAAKGNSWNTRWLSDPLENVVGAVVHVAMKDDALLKQLLAKVTPELLKPYISGKQAAQLMLFNKKQSRTKDEEDYDDENELFVFIGRPAFKEVPEGSGNFRKTLEIEQLMKVDGYDADAHQMVSMMKLRARHQGENSEVYQIRLPAGTIKQKRISGTELDDWLIDLVNTHKQLVR